jgi:uncharacterized protein
MRFIPGAVLLFCWAAPLCAQARPPIMDVHMHAMSVGARTAGMLCVNDAIPCDRPASAYRTNEEIMQGTLEYMDRYNIVLGVLSGSEVRRWTAAAPGRFIPAAFDMRNLDSLRTALTTGGFGVMGEIGVQYSGRRSRRGC